VRWDDLRQSTNIEDVRGSTGGGARLRLGVGGTLLALAAAYFFGVDPRLIMGCSARFRRSRRWLGRRAELQSEGYDLPE